LGGFSVQIRSTILILTSVAILVEAGCARSARDYLARGNKLFEAGKYDDAEIEYRKAIQKDPKFGEAHFRFGLALMEQNRGVEAYTPLSQAAELMPENEDAKARLADVILAFYVADPQNRKTWYERIGKLADQLLSRNPSSFDGLRLKGELALLDRHPEDAIEFFEKANQIKPMRPDLIQGLVQALFLNNRFADGERLARQLIAKDASFGPIYDVVYRQYLSMKRGAEAEGILKLKAANNPKNDAFVLQLARHYASAGNSAEMNATLQRLLNDPKDFPKANLLVGDFYAALRKWDQAFAHFEEGARSNPKEKLVYQQRMTGALMAQGKNTEAAQLVELILKDQPKNTEAHRVRAVLRLQTGKPDNIAAASAELQELVKAKPDDAPLRSTLGNAYLAQGNLDQARAEFLQVLRLRNRDLPASITLAAISLNQRRPEDALRYVDEVLSRDPRNSSAQSLHADAMIALGRYGEARTELTRLQRQFPGSAGVQYQLGVLALAERKFDEAERIFQKLYQPGQRDSRPAEGLVEAYVAESQFDRAIQLLNGDLKAAPDSVAARRMLAATAARAGKFDLAISEYQQLISKDQKSVDLRVQLADVHRRKGDLSTAIGILEQAEQVAPKNPEPVMFRSALLESTGRTAEAKAGYQRVLQLIPDNPNALNSMAFLIAETNGNLDDALQLIQRALKQKPDQPSFLDTLGYIYLRGKKVESAVQTFDSLVRRQPGNPTFHYHLGWALVEKGEKVRAKDELNSALTNNPSPEEAARIKELMSKIG
jgi:tetratricopeptide (TPR) repeat protein